MNFQFESFVIRVLCRGARANASRAWARRPDITSMEWWKYDLVVLISSLCKLFAQFPIVTAHPDSLIYRWTSIKSD